MERRRIFAFRLLVALFACLQVACSDSKKSKESIQKVAQLEKVEVKKLGEKHWKIYTDIIIDAPVEKVWKTLMDFENAPNWSSSFQGIKEELVDESKVTVLYIFNGQKLEIPHTLSYTEGKEFGWSDPLGGPLKGFRDNHKYIVEKISDSKTKFIQTDDFKPIGESNMTSYDIASRTAKSYPIFNRELKQEAEKN
ncbi:SRPBCC family protein [uncultured Kordia sp.]|uniref:SRPBCC family protein n=1 Tax=uncultured Kordia sp. TaxID=507699 RepID=UPI00260483AD|nr:SRPBCC family protein [uncultured Kordia sp.]